MRVKGGDLSNEEGILASAWRGCTLRLSSPR